MLHATPDESFFHYSDQGLDGEACRLILNRLDDDICARFLGNPMVGYQFSETTATHVVRTYQTIEKTLLSVLPDTDTTRATLERHKAMITVHDTSDIIREMIVASTETDPQQKTRIADALLSYDLAVTPFTYKLALFAAAEKDEALFNDTITSIREKTLHPDQHGRGLSLDEVLAFSAKSVNLVHVYDTDFSRYPFWHASQTNQKVAHMMTFYNDIEQTLSFDGLQSQIHEKCDGTAYALHIHKVKTAQNLAPTLRHVPSHLQNRINNRFEKNLLPLFQQAEKFQQTEGQRDKTLAAIASINFCYDISKQIFQSAKNYVGLVPLDGEPSESDHPSLHEAFNDTMQQLCSHPDATHHLLSADVADIYQSAQDDLNRNGILWLPQNGKTLFESAASPFADITRVALPYAVRTVLDNRKPL